MSILDIILIVLLALSAFSGLRKGLIRSLGSIIALFLGAYITSNFYLEFYTWASQWLSLNEAAGKILAFIVLFIIASKGIAIIFYLIEKAYNLLVIIPGSKYINNILGGVFGLLEGALFLGLIFHVSSQYILFEGQIFNILTKSFVLPYLNAFIEFILPVLPQAIKAIQNLI